MTPKTEKSVTPRLGLVCITHSDEVRYRTVTRKRLLQFDAGEQKRRLRDLYAALGRLARRELPGWTLALLSADRRLEAQVGVEWTDALRTRNGGIPVRVVVGGERDA